MSFTWYLNNTHDLVVLNGSLQTVYGADEVKQRIIIALQHSWQEYFLNVQDGVPWNEIILGSKDKKIVETIIRKAILDVPNVIGIVSFLITPSLTIARGWEISCSVEVIGSTDSEIVLISLSSRDES